MTLRIYLTTEEARLLREACLDTADCDTGDAITPSQFAYECIQVKLAERR